MGEGRHVGNVKPREVAAYLNGRGPVTRDWHKKYIVLRGFFRYALSRGYLSASPLPSCRLSGCAAGPPGLDYGMAKLFP